MLSSIKGCLPSKIIFCQRLTFVKGHLLSMFFFHQMLSSVKVCPLSKVIFCPRLSSVKGCLPSKFVFRHMSSSVKGCPPSKVVFRQNCLTLTPLALDFSHTNFLCLSSLKYIFSCGATLYLVVSVCLSVCLSVCHKF